MPNRVVKESINESRGLTSCSFFAQDLYKRLITYADDYGRFNADPQIMVARLYPRELAVVSLDDLVDGLIELAGVGKISFYTSEPRDEVYGSFPNWGEHQRIRDSKKKAPDPKDTKVNDWYCRRFIPTDMKAAIIERDEFKCQICGKHIAEVDDARRLVKMATGTFHIDHIVPCSQGGSATMENLRLTCPKCNLSRKKTYDYGEVLQYAKNTKNSPQLAATRRNSRPESNPIQSNPIQSEVICGEPSSPPVAQLQLNDGSYFDVTKEFVEELQKLYPAVDIMQELRNMIGWCMANPTRRKTKTGIKRFITTWLAKEQNRGHSQGAQAQSGRPKNEYRPLSIDDLVAPELKEG